MRAFRPQFLRSRRGSVLIVLLITLVFAALLLTRLVEASSTDLLITMRTADRERLRADAYSALETTLAALADFRAIDGALYAPAQGWGDPLDYAGYVPRPGVKLEITFEDESAKLSLPTLRPDTLPPLFVQLGLGPNDAARVADALLAWMQPGYNATSGDVSPDAYQRNDPPAQPPYRPLRSFDELAAINVARDYFYDADGQPTQLWRDFTERVSLYQFAGTNLNTAGAAVLLAAGWDQTQVDALQKHLGAVAAGTNAPPFFRSTADARRQLGKVALNGFNTQISCLRIIVTAREGAASMRLTALVAPPSAARLPSGLVADPANPANTARGLASPARATPDARAAQPAGPGATPGRPGGNNAETNSLRYPFAVLEISESTPPPPPASS
ncbi:MAG: general secretion pathway protein GspK [Opitutae bacterium]|nr:general secretion pathway protein GspK [Opitutae bacterium]